MKKFLAVFALLALMAIPAMADTVVWSQLWDSTPPFTWNYDTVQVELGGSGLGSFAASMNSFNTGSGINSTLESPFLVEATSATPWDGNLGSNGNLFNLNFGSALNVPFEAQFRYLLADQVVSRNSWFYNGTGAGNNPVSSWSSITDDSFTPVPEPATMTLLASGLGLIGLAGFRRKKNSA